MDMKLRTRLNETRMLGEIVSEFPEAARIFTEHGIDFCCGGRRTLREALAERNIDAAQFVGDLNLRYEQGLESGEDARDWRSAEPTELVDHILSTHHVFTKKELREIDSLLFTVLKAHFDNSGEQLLELHRLFGTLKTELEEHLVKEEEQLFPLIRDFLGAGSETAGEELTAYMAATEDEHETAGSVLHRIEELTGRFTPPSHACPSYELLYRKLQALQNDIFTHIHLENNVLFEAIG